MRKPDRRIERTRTALLRAFVALFFERSYAQIRIADIVERANVGRSTFYQHYRNKDEILADSIRVPFTQLSKAVDGPARDPALVSILDHFWQNRSQARSMQSPAARRVMVRILAQLLRERLHARCREAGVPIDPAHMSVVAHTLAEALFGTMAAWILGEIACGSAELADILHRVSRDAAQGLIG
jgi:AcrR family transcriptional regulator